MTPQSFLAARRWAISGAALFGVGGVMFLAGTGLGIRLFALFVLAQGAKALSVGVELRAGGDAASRDRLVKLLVLIVVVLTALGVARLTGTATHRTAGLGTRRPRPAERAVDLGLLTCGGSGI